MQRIQKRNGPLELRILIIFILIFILFFGILLRVFSLVLGSGLQSAAAKQSQYSLVLGRSRGAFYDRNLKPLTGITYEYKAAAAPGSDVASFLKEALLLSADPIEQIREKASKGKPFLFNAHRAANWNNGIASYAVPKRYSGLAAHLIGYPTSATESGYTGLENSYDEWLKQASGQLSLSFTVDALGRSLPGFQPTVTDTFSHSNQGVQLTIDRELQASVDSILDRTGAAIVMDMAGNILASTSYPSFNPNDLASSLNDSGQSLFNRALNPYNVGSTFKLVIAAAALEAGISPATAYDCTGSIDISGQIMHCNKREGHGKQSMQEALAHSCNPYFINLAGLTGAEKIYETAYAMGFGQPTTLSPKLSSAAGILSPVKELLPPVSLANIAIGQGRLLATPLQIAVAVTAIANGGYKVAPRLVKALIQEDKEVSVAYSQEKEKRILSSNTTKTLRTYMESVFQTTSAEPYRPFSGSAAGKTATAETGIVQDGKEIYQTWLSGFYPANDPKVTIVVVIENGQSGFRSAGPYFKKIADDIATRKDLLK